MSWKFDWRFWKRHAKDPMPDPGDPNWERSLINRMALEFLKERRRGQLWGGVFKGALLLYLVVLLTVAVSRDLWRGLEAADTHTALVEVKGPISADADASADRVISGLRDAFEAKNVKGIVLRIDSPGGSPVQSGYINDEIARLKAKYKEEKDKDMPVYAVAADICASGAYYIAVAADKIYADPASLVGSIGVRIDSFGFQRAMEDLGIERRLLTAGENKGILDPFSPLRDQQRQFIEGVLEELHGQFITAVKEGRGERLKGGEDLFSGLFWSGEQALRLGLVDGLGSAGYVAREVVGAETIVDYTRERDIWESFAGRIGAALAQGLSQAVAALAAPAVR